MVKQGHFPLGSGTDSRQVGTDLISLDILIEFYSPSAFPPFSPVLLECWAIMGNFGGRQGRLI